MRRVNYSGLVIAGIGFFLTRFTVTLALYEDPVRFYFAGVVPLVLGLGLAAFGVALAVADVEVEFVRTTAMWCVVGACGMLVLVALTLLGSTPDRAPTFATIRSQTYLSNFLIGGSVGGTLTGLYAARTHRHRGQLQRQAYRLVVLNRVLRHEVLNAVNVIRGYAAVGPDDHPRAPTIIQERSDTIEQTIEGITYLSRAAGTNQRSDATVDLDECLGRSVESVTERHPDARVSIGSYPADLTVRANDRLEQVFTHLLENSLVHASDAPVEVGVATTATSVRISVSDHGPGLPDRQRTLLETGQIDEFDDPRSGFGLNIVRLLVESYGGRIETDVTGDRTTITVVLPRADTGAGGLLPGHSGSTDLRPATSHLVIILAAGVLAGVPYGIAAEQLGGSVAAIGVFYGFQNPVVGWLTHEFHSVVFAFVFAGLVSLSPARYRDDVLAYVGIGTAWALFLWFVAAGVVAPIWLRLLGIPASVPTLSPVLLVSHLAWGISLGVLTAWGYTYATPRLRRLGQRLRHPFEGAPSATNWWR